MGDFAEIPGTDRPRRIAFVDFECGGEGPVGCLLRLREALAGRADAIARLAELRERPR